MDIQILHKGEEYDIEVSYYEAQMATSDCAPLGEIHFEIISTTNPDPLSAGDKQDIEDKAFNKMFDMLGYTKYVEYYH